MSSGLGGYTPEGLLPVGAIQTLGRPGMKRAVMAVAHTMLIIGYHMLKTGQS
ncbi:MAG TPA: hypothetical protein VKV15_26235 [Bryobacteraceae bacterium]|nr:hypothetical protein [Bryobacteraceae bacterium]